MSRTRHDMQDVLEETGGLGTETGPPVAGAALPGDAGPPSRLASEVVDLRTSTELRIPGRPVPTSVDDGSAGDALLAQTSDDRLAAFELPTGHPLWSVADAGTGLTGASGRPGVGA